MNNVETTTKEKFNKVKRDLYAYQDAIRRVRVNNLTQKRMVAEQTEIQAIVTDAIGGGKTNSISDPVSSLAIRHITQLHMYKKELKKELQTLEAVFTKVKNLIELVEIDSYNLERNIIELKFIGGSSFDEIAEILDIDRRYCIKKYNDAINMICNQI